MRGLALSGGGFRATLFHLGVISYLYDVESAWRAATAENVEEGAADIDETTGTPVHAMTDGPPAKLPPRLIAREALSGIRYITSVSGGSILAAHLVLNWEKYTDFKEPANFDKAAGELIAFARQDIRGQILRRIPYTFGIYIASVFWRKSDFLNSRMPNWMRRSTADSLERRYDKHLYRGAMLRNLIGPRPQLFLLTTNLGSETSSAAFTAFGLSTANRDYDHRTLRVSRAVAASSAFPGMFPAVLYDPLDPSDAELRLSDGGIFDNLGVRKFQDLLDAKYDIRDVIVSDASIRFRATFGLEFLEPVTVPIKAADILFRRVYSFELEAARRVDTNNKNCTFTFLKLRERIDGADTDDSILYPEHQKSLHATRTDLDEFSDVEVAALIRHGYIVARSMLKYPLPNGAAPNSIVPRWNPLSDSKHTRAIYNRSGSSNEEIAAVTAKLQASEWRRKRLASLRDWVTYVTLGFILLPVILYLGLVIYTAGWDDENRTLESDWTISDQQNTLTDLGKITATIVPQTFVNKYALTLQTIDVGAPSAITSAVDFVTLAKSKGFKDVYIFKMKVPSVSGLENYAYRPVAVYESEFDADVARPLALQEFKGDARIETVKFADFCPTAQWIATGGYYDCNNSVEELERRGFVMILQKNLSAAIGDFDRASNISPLYHDVSDITTFLRSKLGSLADKNATAAQKVEIWNEIFGAVLRDFNSGMPTDIKQLFQAAAAANAPKAAV